MCGNNTQKSKEIILIKVSTVFTSRGTVTGGWGHVLGRMAVLCPPDLVLVTQLFIMIL